MSVPGFAPLFLPEPGFVDNPGRRGSLSAPLTRVGRVRAGEARLSTGFSGEPPLALSLDQISKSTDLASK
ncbi:hypothetical protein PluTT01m_01705 [Photorhabdus laumondii subsp. laumondii]|nr:hypothetical protein A4R40_01625 [Photorhabdus laumondii subsp. laumondii]AXG41139.1 hypothetical protein PluDJC_01740 [Photorhabdus laumondii subsp. laumondii]AXG45654.1 hypothetical protein PluTT01m_01705 [Photorhabdus laumondii subsp. laumondii]